MNLNTLLPYNLEIKKNGCIRTALKEYRTLLVASLRANATLKEGAIEQFDSLVGENACEIRAIWTCTMGSNLFTNTDDLNDQILEILNKIDSILNSSKIESLMKSEKNLGDVLEEEKLNISLSLEEIYLLQSYLLCQLKTAKFEGDYIPALFVLKTATPQKLKAFGDVSTSFAKSLVSKLRRNLATASVQFVRDQAVLLQDITLMKMVSEEFTVDHNALPCIPMFWTYKTVLQTAQNQKIPLVIHVKFLKTEENGFTCIDEEKLFYKVDSTGQYILTEPNENDLETVSCVIQGIATLDKNEKVANISQWIANFQQTSVIDTILAGAADHRQYPDPSLDSRFNSEEFNEYQSYKEMAKQAGFSFENTSTFFIQHVYACLPKTLLIEDSVFIEEELQLIGLN